MFTFSVKNIASEVDNRTHILKISYILCIYVLAVPAFQVESLISNDPK